LEHWSTTARNTHSRAVKLVPIHCDCDRRWSMFSVVSNQTRTIGSRNWP